MATGAKRRRVESDAPSSAELASSSPLVLLDCQRRLKKALVGKEPVERFLAHQHQFQQVRLSPAKMTVERTGLMSPRLVVRRLSLQLLGLVRRCSERRALAAAADDRAAWDSVVKECLSVIANCCHFSFAACQEVCCRFKKGGRR